MKKNTPERKLVQQAPLIIGNWKQNPMTEKEAMSLSTKLNKALMKERMKAVLVPPAIFLPVLSKVKSTRITLGIQNTSVEDVGAYTGSISFGQSLSYKTRYVLVGHSEVRAAGETDALIAKKLVYVFRNKGIPVLCVGEHTRDATHAYFDVIGQQLMGAFAEIAKKNISDLVIAYEPIWAIGKQAVREATPAEFHEIKIFIRKMLQEKYGITNPPPIIYGGSVTTKNAYQFTHEGNADGLLVGRASLDAVSFMEIIKESNKQ